MAARDRQLTVTDLRVSVYLRALHPEFFQIRVRRSIAHSALDSEVWLLDGGHVITFVDGPNAITEVLAPRDLELPKRGLARTVDLSEVAKGVRSNKDKGWTRSGAGDRDYRLETRGPVVYQMAYQVDTESPETYMREAEELLASARQGHLFTEGARQAAKRPFSYAVPEPRGAGLLVHTWHGFPAENTILKTQTLIERL